MAAGRSRSVAPIARRTSTGYRPSGSRPGHRRSPSMPAPPASAPSPSTGRPVRRLVLPGVPAVLPPPGLGRARRRRDLGRRCRPPWPRSPTLGRGAGRPSASPTSARPSWRGDRRTSEPLHRALVWQDRRTADRCAALEADGLLPTGPGHDRPGRSIPTSRHRSSNGCLDRRWRHRRTRRRRRHHRQLARVEAHRRAVHATDATNASPHAAVRHRARSVERRAVRRCSASRRTCCPRSDRHRATFGDDRCRCGLRCRHPDHRHRRRPARGAVRPGLRSTPGDAKNTYGTGSFVLMNVGAHVPRTRRGPVDHRRLDARHGAAGSVEPTYALEGAIFVTGAAVQWLRDGLGIIDEAADLEPLALPVRRHRRRLPGARLHRARQPLVGPLRPGHARRPHPGHGPARARPGGDRGHGPPDPRRRRCHDRGVGPPDAEPARRRRRLGHGHCCCSCRPTSSACRCRGPRSGDHGARCRLPRRTRHGGLGFARRAPTRWQLDVEVTPAGDRATLDAAHAQWHRAVERSRDWARP